MFSTSMATSGPDRQSFLTTFAFWDNSLQVGFIIVIVLGFVMGGSIGRRILRILFLGILWIFIWGALAIVGSLLGVAAESYQEVAQASAATPELLYNFGK